MKMKKFGNEKLGKGLMITGGIITVIGTIGAIVAKFSDNEDNYGSIDVCENNVMEDDNYDTEIEFDLNEEIEKESI